MYLLFTEIQMNNVGDRLSSSTGETWATAFTHRGDVLHFYPTRREYLIRLPCKKRSDMKRSPMVFCIILMS